MDGKYNGRGLAEEDVDKLVREDDYNNGKALKAATTKRDIKRLELEIAIIQFAPWVCGFLFIAAVSSLWFTNQANAAVTLTISTFTGVSGYVFGNKGTKKGKK